MDTISKFLSQVGPSQVAGYCTGAPDGLKGPGKNSQVHCQNGILVSGSGWIDGFVQTPPSVAPFTKVIQPLPKFPTALHPTHSVISALNALRRGR